MKRVSVVSIIFALFSVSFASASSQDATPSPVMMAECLVEPRPFADFAAVAEAPPGELKSRALGTPVATPAPLPPGRPADSAIVAAVTATMQDVIACGNAGDQLRVYALYSEDYLRRMLGGIEIDPDEVARATPMPVPPDRQVALVAIADVQTLADGRVSAVVRTTDSFALILFVEADGRYLIDGGYLVPPEATSAP